MSTRWDLIHLLARVDGNDQPGEPVILEHLYGGFADALIAESWSAPRVTSDYARRTALSRARLEVARSRG